MKKIRISVVIILICQITMLFNCNNVKANTYNTSEIWSENYVDGWNLEWCAGSFFDKLLSASNEEFVINYEYNETGKRVSKIVNGVETKYEYDKYDNLMSEITGEEEINYIYEYSEEQMKYKLTGFSYKDVLYEYVYENDIITGFSCNGNEVVRYVYTYDICEDVLGKNDSGEWISMLENSDFIGNVNPIRYNGYYYDKETKWYYVGRYYSAELNRFIDGVSPIRAIELKENYPSYIVDAKTYTIGVNFQGNKNSRAYYDEYVVAKVIQLESNYSTDDQDLLRG